MMKWIKTSDRLPKLTGTDQCYFVYFNGRIEGTFIILNQKDLEIFENEVEEWLDESKEEIGINKSTFNLQFSEKFYQPDFDILQKEITDTQRLDWLENLSSISIIYEYWNPETISLREFIDEQIKENE